MFDVAKISGFVKVARIADHENYIFVNMPKVGGNSIRSALHRCEAMKSGIFNKSENDIIRTETAVNSRPDGKLFSRFPLDFSEWTRMENSLKNSTVFTFVRNPYTRLISAYKEKVILTFKKIEEYENGNKNDPMEKRRIQHRIKRINSLGLSIDNKPSFEQFVCGVTSIPVERADIHLAPQSYLTAFHTIPYDFVGRLESYDEDMSKLSSMLFGSPEFWKEAELKDGGKRNVNYKGGGSKENLLIECPNSSIELIKQYYKKDFEYFGYSQEIDNADHSPPSIPPNRDVIQPKWSSIAISAGVHQLTYKTEKFLHDLLMKVR